MVLYALTAGFAGYTSSVQYKLMNGDNWVSKTARILFENCPAFCRLHARVESAAHAKPDTFTQRLLDQKEPLPTSTAIIGPSTIWVTAACWLNPVPHHQHWFLQLHVQLL